MGEQTGISWTDHTFNPWWGCTEVSQGCANCYARELAKRMRGMPWGKGTPRVRTGPANWREPIKWQADAATFEILHGRRQRVFCASMADVFDAEAPEGALTDLWATIRATPNLDWQLLTKRPERIQASLPQDWGEGYPNVWLGTSVEDQATADLRVPILLGVPAVVRFLSCEPLLGPLDLTLLLDGKATLDTLNGTASAIVGRGTVLLGNAPRIAWVIAGGESGRKHRPMDPAWVRSLRDQCAAADAAFFLKQMGGLRPGGDAILDGQLHHAFPRGA